MTTIVRDAIQSWRENPVHLFGLLGLLLVLAVWLWQLPHFLAGNSTIWPQYATAFYDMLFYTAWGFAVLLVLTAFTRTVSLKLLLALWFLGVFAVHGLVVAVELPFLNSMLVVDMSIWVAPVVETLVVLVVIVGFYTLATFRHGTHPTVSDGLLVGFATGAGIAFHEDMTYRRLISIGPRAEYGSVGNMGQDIWWSYVFPLIGWQGLFNIRQFGNGIAGNFTLYHAGWGTLLGIGIGVAYVHRHRFLAWIVGLFAIAVTYFDHMSGNWGVSRPLEPAPIVGDLFQAGDVNGVTELVVYILLVAIAGAIAVDLLVFRRTAGWIDGLPPVRSALGGGRDDRSYVCESSPGAPGRLRGLRRAVELDTYARHRRAAMVGLYRHAASGRDASGLSAALSRLYTSGRRLGLVASVGILGAIVLVGLATLNAGGAVANAEALACAGCVSPSRFMGPVPSSLGAVMAAVIVSVYTRSTYRFAELSGSRDGRRTEHGDGDGNTVEFSKLSREEKARIRNLATRAWGDEFVMMELSPEDRAKVTNYAYRGSSHDVLGAAWDSFRSLVTSAVETVQSMASDVRDVVSWKHADGHPRPNVFQLVVDYVNRVKNNFIEVGERYQEGKLPVEPTENEKTDDDVESASE